MKAGIGPNGLVSKIASDLNKPNGQFRVESSRESILNFIRPLPVRKIPFIGKMTTALLYEAFEIETVQQLYEKRAILPFGFKKASLQHFARVICGDGVTMMDSAKVEFHRHF